MPTPIEVERQIDFERKQIRGGLEKLRKDTKNLEEKTYASATVYGSVAISEIMIDLIKHIDQKKEYKRQTKRGKDYRIHHNYTLPLDTDIQALLIAKVTFDHVFSPRKVNHNDSTISIAAGHAIEGEAQMSY